MQYPEIKRQSAGDLDMEYLVYGQTGPVVVLLHATGFLPWLWHPIAMQLLDKYQVIAPSLYAHRQGDPYTGGVGWLSLAKDLKNLLDTLGIDSACFVGHSMGAAVATLVHTVLGVPADKLVLIEPIFLPEFRYSSPLTVDQYPLATKALKRRNHWSDRYEVLQDFKSKPFFQSWDEQVLSLYVAHGTSEDNANDLQLTCPPQQEAALFMGSMQYNPWPELPKVACPAMVVEGQLSVNKTVINLKQIAGLIPQGQYTEVAGAGHLVPMEKPADVARMIKTFLAS